MPNKYRHIDAMGALLQLGSSSDPVSLTRNER